jgi:predicted AAA+ superfamily ATPase
MVFPLVEEFKVGAKGGYVTVDGKAVAGFPDRAIKILCNSADAYEAATAKIEERKETDEETIERMRERFDMLEDMTRACKKGDVRAMIVSGPPGVGKSHGVEKVLGKHDLLADIAGDSKLKKYTVVKGAMSAIGLYCKLYQYADKDNVIVFDDCDSIFADELSLNILKAALDSKKNRTIHWNTDSYKLRNEGVPDSFRLKVALSLLPT